VSRQRPYAAFGRALRDAMSASRYTSVRLSREAEYASSRLSDARMGKTLPTEQNVARLARLLDAPHLVTLAHEHLHRTCATCGVAFIQERRGPREARFCGDTCRRRWHSRQETRRKDEARPDRVRSLARQNTSLLDRIEELAAENAAAQAVFDAFCMECEPEGACRTPSCVIQVSGRSPLPLADERVRVA
jgi:hypothetical protein